MSLYVAQSGEFTVEGKDGPDQTRTRWAVYENGEKLSPDYYSKYGAKEQMRRMNIQRGKPQFIMMDELNEPDGVA